MRYYTFIVHFTPLHALAGRKYHDQSTQKHEVLSLIFNCQLCLDILEERNLDLALILIVFRDCLIYLIIQYKGGCWKVASGLDWKEYFAEYRKSWIDALSAVIKLK